MGILNSFSVKGSCVGEKQELRVELATPGGLWYCVTMLHGHGKKRRVICQWTYNAQSQAENRYERMRKAHR